MARFSWRFLAVTTLLAVSQGALAQATPASDLPPGAAVPIPAPPPTYSIWVLLLAGIVLLLLVAAGVRLVMNGLRSSRHHRHRSNQSVNTR